MPKFCRIQSTIFGSLDHLKSYIATQVKQGRESGGWELSSINFLCLESIQHLKRHEIARRLSYSLLIVLSYVFSAHISKDLLTRSVLTWQAHGKINVPLKARFSLRASLSLHASYLHSLSGILSNIASYPMTFLNAGNQFVNGRIYVDAHVKHC